MIRTARIAAACALALSASAALAGEDPASGEGKTVEANVIGLDGNSLGKVTLVQTPTGVLVSTDLKGLPEGEHGFHFHEKGVCDPAEGFKTSGGHFAAGAHEHGLMTMGGPHGGDMPNQYVGPDGVLKEQIFNTGVTLTPGPKSLLDADGSALVIHAGADDYTSQPAGAAGARIACAVISPGE
ncbi:superoxide dismutase family protein [Novosphingobium mangrovi (ex Huang et al. 2023)]|uniref:Superoxide dismutase family protein n=1 Tax=Novosphingobium mangrovi (ex Huang et al. 2023) TaxID=2976432 RepID=A0ABT2I6Y9_9SPHN|nr:superoxide dismutase family protein [Novosphingobium mangrovi (ex Huang et al. 2023)]MCT2400577.1 superoxide dismutase family protein [Novosphingobium mangrovi (ex Huang et al. 2023)]